MGLFYVHLSGHSSHKEADQLVSNNLHPSRWGEDPSSTDQSCLRLWACIRLLGPWVREPWLSPSTACGSLLCPSEWTDKRYIGATVNTAPHRASILKSEDCTHVCTACVVQDGAVDPPCHKWELGY